MLILAALIGLAHADYPPEVRNEFIVGCAQSPDLQGHCECTLDALQKEVPYSRYLEADTTIRAGGVDVEFQQAMVKSSASCMKPETYQKDFLQACTGAGASDRQCTCTLNQLVERLGYEKLIYESTETAIVGPTDAFINSMVASQLKCIVPEEHRKTFAQGCESAGSPESTCLCMHDFMVEKLGLEKLIVAETQMAFGKQAPEFNTLVPAAQAACVE